MTVLLRALYYIHAQECSLTRKSDTAKTFLAISEIKDTKRRNKNIEPGDKVWLDRDGALPPHLTLFDRVSQFGISEIHAIRHNIDRLYWLLLSVFCNMQSFL
jgi:hypothetical protein